MPRSKIAIAIALIIAGLFPFLSGCDSLDGRVNSQITGQESSPEEIRAALIQRGNDFTQRRIKLTAEAESLNAEESAVAEIGQTEINSAVAERERFNDAIEGGIDLIGTATKLAFPQAAAAVDLVTPLARQGLALFGAGGIAAAVAHRRGQKKGAGTVAAAIDAAAKEDANLRTAIKEGQAGTVLTREFRKAPKPVKAAIDENEVV